MSKVSFLLSLFLAFKTIISIHGLTLPFHIQNYTTPKNKIRNLDSINPIKTEYQTSTRTIVNLCLGFPPQCFDLVIQTNSFYFWVYDGNSATSSVAKHKMNIFDSESLERLTNDTHKLTYSGNKVEGYRASDTLWVGQTQVEEFNFILATMSSYQNIDGMIGMGYDPSFLDSEISFLHQLYNKDIISHKVFVQEFTRKNEGLLHIGDLPQEIKDNPDKASYCRALDIYRNDVAYRNNNWECELTGFFYGDNRENPDIHELQAEKITFLSFRKRTFIPAGIYEHFKNNYFDKALKEGKCSLYKSKRYRSFECRVIDDLLPDINLIFSNTVLKLKAQDLFQQMDDRYMFILFMKKNLDNWVLGRSVLKNFHTIYDSQNGKIGFYNRDGLVFSLNKDKIEEVENPIEEEVDISQMPVTKEVDYPLERKERKKISNAFIAQVMFGLVISIAVIIVGVIGFFSYRKYRRKNLFPSNDYFYKKTENILREAF